MDRSLRMRLVLMWLFVATDQFDKPGCTHEYASLRWWIECWHDTQRLGATQ